MGTKQDLFPNGPPPFDPKDIAGGHVLGQEQVIALARDVVDEKAFAHEKETHFFAEPGKPWGLPFKNMTGPIASVLGVTVMATTTDGEGWEPVVGARCVLRAQMDSLIIFDACTRGDGSTIQFPDALVLLLRDTLVRLEVWPVPKYAGRPARAVVHSVIQEKVR